MSISLPIRFEKTSLRMRFNGAGHWRNKRFAIAICPVCWTPHASRSPGRFQKKQKFCGHVCAWRCTNERTIVDSYDRKLGLIFKMLKTHFLNCSECQKNWRGLVEE